MSYIPSSTGHWVNEKFMQLAEILRDYDQCLELRWIPPENRTREDGKPYVVIYNNPNGLEEVVLHADESQTPEEILALVWSADNKTHNVLDHLDNLDRSRRTFELKQRMDDAEARRDFAAFLIGTKKNFIKTDNPVTGEKNIKLDSQLRRLD